MRYLSIFLALFLVAGCDFLESDHNMYPDSTSQLRVINSTGMNLTVGIEAGENNNTTLDISADSDTEFSDLTAGPADLFVIVNTDTLSELKEGFLEFEQPSSLYILGDTATSYEALFLDHKKTFSDSSSYVRFINAVTTVPAVDIYFSTDDYYEENDSLYYNGSNTFIGETGAFLSDVAFGDGNLSYDEITSKNTISIIVTEAGKADNVLTAERFENSAQESKTLVIKENKLHSFIDQFE